MSNKLSCLTPSFQKKKTLTFLSITFLLLSVFFLNLQPCAAQSSLIFSDGFESGNFSHWTGVDGGFGSHSASVTTEYSTEGSHSAKFIVYSQDDGCYAYKANLSITDKLVLNFTLEFNMLPPSQPGEIVFGGFENELEPLLIVLRNTGDNMFWGVFDGEYHFEPHSSNPSINTTYTVTLVLDKKNSHSMLYINQVEKVSASRVWTSLSYDCHVGIDAAYMNVDSGLIAYVDEVSVSDSTTAIGTLYLTFNMNMAATLLGSEYAFYSMSNPWNTVSGNLSNQHAFQPVHSDTIIEVDKVVDGDTWKYLAYDSDPNGTQIYLYYSNDTDGTWTAYSGNPILGPQAYYYRWPSTTYVDGVFNMFVEDVTGGTLERWTSTDGINFAFLENIKSGGNAWKNPFIWFNPNDNNWYLYSHDSSGSTESLNVRNAGSLDGLKSASESIVLSRNQPFGSPTVMFHDGKYWLLAEIRVADNSWRTVAYYSTTSSSSGFVEAKNSPILTSDEACPMLFMMPDQLSAYIFTTVNQHAWYVTTREVYIEQITIPIQASWIASDSTLYASSNTTVLKSSDQGNTWHQLKNFSSGEVDFIYVDSRNYVYASPVSNVTTDLGLWRSNDTGSSWTNVLPLPNGCSIRSMDEDSNGNLFAGIYTFDNTTGNARVYKSIDGGASWATVYYDSNARHVHCITVDKGNNYVYAAVGDQGVEIWHTCYVLRSTDGGVSWHQILSGLPQILSIEAVSGNPGVRIFATDYLNGQIYRTTDDLTFNGPVLDTGGQSYGYWIRTNPINGYIYAGFTSGEHPSQWVAGIWLSIDNGQTWAVYRSFDVHSAYLGSGWASNFVQGTLYYTIQLDSGWQNGAKISPNNEIPPLSIKNTMHPYIPNEPSSDENQTNTENTEPNSPQPNVDLSQLSLNPTAQLLSLGTVAVSTVLISDSANSKKRNWFFGICQGLSRS
jgi:photosystem II stability/assembly factor-like uncharacterized protein